MNLLKMFISFLYRFNFKTLLPLFFAFGLLLFTIVSAAVNMISGKWLFDQTIFFFFLTAAGIASYVLAMLLEKLTNSPETWFIPDYRKQILKSAVLVLFLIYFLPILLCSFCHIPTFLFISSVMLITGFTFCIVQIFGSNLISILITSWAVILMNYLLLHYHLFIQQETHFIDLKWYYIISLSAIAIGYYLFVHYAHQFITRPKNANENKLSGFLGEVFNKKLDNRDISAAEIGIKNENILKIRKSGNKASNRFYLFLNAIASPLIFSGTFIVNILLIYLCFYTVLFYIKPEKIAPIVIYPGFGGILLFTGLITTIDIIRHRGNLKLLWMGLKVKSNSHFRFLHILSSTYIYAKQLFFILLFLLPVYYFLPGAQNINLLLMCAGGAGVYLLFIFYANMFQDFL